MHLRVGCILCMVGLPAEGGNSRKFLMPCILQHRNRHTSATDIRLLEANLLGYNKFGRIIKAIATAYQDNNPVRDSSSGLFLFFNLAGCCQNRPCIVFSRATYLRFVPVSIHITWQTFGFVLAAS